MVSRPRKVLGEACREIRQLWRHSFVEEDMAGGEGAVDETVSMEVGETFGRAAGEGEPFGG